MKLLHLLLLELLKPLGFRSGKDFFASAFGVHAYKPTLLAIQLSGTLLVWLVAFCTEWVWDPPRALVLLIIIDLLNARYGYLIAKKVQHDRFRWVAFERTGGKIISTLLLLALFKNAIAAYPYYKLAADGLFGWLFTSKMAKLIQKMIVLGIQEKGLAKVFTNLVLLVTGSKHGTALVDAMQDKPTEPPTTSEPAAPEAPAPTPD